LSYATYRVATHVLWPLAAAAAAVREVTGAPEWRERVGCVPDARRGSTWLHAASVGEVAAVTPLALALSNRREGAFVTVVTVTGRTAAARSLPSVPAVRRFIGIRGPSALLLTETELWPNTVFECSRAGVPVGMVNGRLSESSLRRYSMSGSPLRELAARLSFAACRTEEDAGRYLELGVSESLVRVVGETKFDKLSTPPEASALSELRESLGFAATHEVVVFGSVRPREEGDVATAVADVLAVRPEARVVVAPRHLERVPSILSELDSRGVSVRLRSSRGAGEARAVVLDTTGELAAVYGVGSVAFVGGTLAPYGGHDPLEPAALGVPVVIGPHRETCSEVARRLLDAGGAFEVSDAAGLADVVLGLLADDAARGRAGERALAVVTDGRGATERTVSFLEELGVLARGSLE
jgi:3-deoxy-D-manno-octulosonic-acid transferase